jgi:hypothetical protein
MEKQINVDLSKQPDFVCPKCDTVHFLQVERLKFIPSYMAGNPVPIIQPLPVFICFNCFYEFQPDDVKAFDESRKIKLS